MFCEKIVASAGFAGRVHRVYSTAPFGSHKNKDCFLQFHSFLRSQGLEMERYYDDELECARQAFEASVELGGGKPSFEVVLVDRKAAAGAPEGITIVESLR